MVNDPLAILEANPKFQSLDEGTKTALRTRLQERITASQPQEKGLGGKVWGALGAPAQKSQEGLDMIANAIPEQVGGPSTNTTVNYVKGIPKVLAETAAEAAPEFVSPASILTAGAVKGVQAVSKVPAVARAASQGLGQLEKLSGTAKGALSEAFHDPSLIRSPGVDEAGKAYEALKTEKVAPAIRSAAKTVKDFLKKATDGTITPQEAHRARKIAWNLRKSKELDQDAVTSAYDLFDGIVKKALPGADKAYRRAVQADSIRNVLPRTETGKVAQLRTMGMAFHPSMWAASPVVQGAAATAAGGIARTGMNLTGIPAALQAYDRLMEKRNIK